MIQRTKEAIRKGVKYWGQALISQPPRMAYVGGWRGHNNLGDEALFQAYKLFFNRCSFLEFTGGRLLRFSARLLPLFEHGMLAGGTLINRDQSWLRAAKECVDLCSQFYVFGTGVGHPCFWSKRVGWQSTLKEWVPILQRCKYVGVRGPLSAELLQSAGISKVTVIGDPILAYASGQFENSDLHISKSIGLNIGQSYSNVWGSEESILSEYIKLATLAKNSGWMVRWFVVWPEDLYITKQAAQASGTEEEIYEIYNDHTLYIHLVRPMSTFVGMKLHAVALATCAYVPSVMLEYQPKCRDYMRSIDQDNVTFRTDKFKVAKIWELVKKWNSERAKVSLALYKCIEPIRNRQRLKAKELMMEMLNS